jgi:hypothetical protein
MCDNPVGRMDEHKEPESRGGPPESLGVGGRCEQENDQREQAPKLPDETADREAGIVDRLNSPVCRLVKTQLAWKLQSVCQREPHRYSQKQERDNREGCHRAARVGEPLSSHIYIVYIRCIKARASLVIPVTKLARSAGRHDRVDDDKLYIDASLVPANASRNSVIEMVAGERSASWE